MHGPLTTMKGAFGNGLGISSVPSPARLGGHHSDRGAVPLAVERNTQRTARSSEVAGCGAASDRPGSASVGQSHSPLGKIATPSRWAWPFTSGTPMVSETPPKEEVNRKYDKETPPKEVSLRRQLAPTPQDKQLKDVRASSQSITALTRPKPAESAMDALVAQFGLTLDLSTPQGKPQSSTPKPKESMKSSKHTSSGGYNASVDHMGEEQKIGLPPPRLASLTDFSVTSPFLGAGAGSVSLDELPSSTRRALMFLQSCPRLPCTPSCGPGYLPPRKDPQLRARPTLVLDLDETLVHCSRGEKSNERPGKTDVNMLVRFEDSPHDGRVRWRPFVELFLSVCSARFELVIFTASDQGYADQVIDELDPHGYISHRLYRRHCTHSRGAFFKECGLLGRPQAKCILVDNSPISVACNPDNSILVKSWYGDAYDRELIDLLPILDQCIASQDVTQYLSARYGLREFLSSIGAQGRSDSI